MKEKEKNLFDLIEDQIEEEKPLEECIHRGEKKTYTVWPGEDFERLTWTCPRCGHIRGRVI